MRSRGRLENSAFELGLIRTLLEGGRLREPNLLCKTRQNRSRSTCLLSLVTNNTDRSIGDKTLLDRSGWGEVEVKLHGLSTDWDRAHDPFTLSPTSTYTTQRNAPKNDSLLLPNVIASQRKSNGLIILSPAVKHRPPLSHPIKRKPERVFQITQTTSIVSWPIAPVRSHLLG